MVSRYVLIFSFTWYPSSFPNIFLFFLFEMQTRTAARMELKAGKTDVARSLILRACDEVPKKMKSVALLDYSRMEEFCGRVKEARAVLRTAQKEAAHEWKVFLEGVLLEIRANNFRAALREVMVGLQSHAGTGRLWAVYLQLKQNEPENERIRIFKEAVREVPKSGEGTSTLTFP